MDRRYKPLIFITIVLIASVMACRLGGRNRVELGETFQSDVGGFIIQTIPDYEVEEFLGMLYMFAPDADPIYGPFIMATGELGEELISPQQILDRLQGEVAGVEFSAAKNTRVDGIDGLMVEFSGQEDGKSIKGRLFTATPRPMQEFFMVAMSPEERWKDFEPFFDAVLKSIRFIDAQPFLFEFDDLDTFDEDWDFTEDWDDPIEETEPPLETAQVIRQWAVFAEASSEFSSEEYAALQATGAPDVDICEENPRAWASAGKYTEEYLVLFYEIPVNPTELVIYQSHNPSQVVSIEFEDITGTIWVLWDGEPHESEFCPDVWTHYIELDEVFYTNTVIILVDQSILGLGWVEIDAVELVGYPLDGALPTSSTQDDRLRYDYTGLMAGPVYQSWLNILVGQSREADLDRIMPIPKSEFIPEWQPHPDHAKTYTYEMPWAGMIGYVEINTDGLVYNKYFNLYDPTDFALDTVNQTVFELLQAKYMGERNLPYADVANNLESPGFLRSEILTSQGKLSSIYWWYGTGGRLIIGVFENGVLLSMADLIYSGPP